VKKAPVKKNNSVKKVQNLNLSSIENMDLNQLRQVFQNLPTSVQNKYVTSSSNNNENVINLTKSPNRSNNNEAQNVLRQIESNTPESNTNSFQMMNSETPDIRDVTIENLNKLSDNQLKNLLNRFTKNRPNLVNSISSNAPVSVSTPVTPGQTRNNTNNNNRTLANILMSMKNDLASNTPVSNTPISNTPLPKKSNTPVTNTPVSNTVPKKSKAKQTRLRIGDLRDMSLTELQQLRDTRFSPENNDWMSYYNTNSLYNTRAKNVMLPVAIYNTIHPDLPYRPSSGKQIRSMSDLSKKTLKDKILRHRLAEMYGISKKDDRNAINKAMRGVSSNTPQSNTPQSNTQSNKDFADIENWLNTELATSPNNTSSLKNFINNNNNLNNNNSNYSNNNSNMSNNNNSNNNSNVSLTNSNYSNNNNVPQKPTKRVRIVKHKVKTPGQPTKKVNQKVENVVEISPSSNSSGLLTQFGKFNLRKHQIEACQVMLEPERKGLFLYYDMGSGKTLTSLAVGKNLINAGQINKVIIACPSAVQAAFKQHLVDMGPQFNRNFTITTHQSLKNETISPNTLLVIDEAHKFRSEGPLFREGLRAALASKKVLLMTGTPLINHPRDIAPLIALIDMKRTVDIFYHDIKKAQNKALETLNSQEAANMKARWDAGYPERKARVLELLLRNKTSTDDKNMGEEDEENTGVVTRAQTAFGRAFMEKYPDTELQTMWERINKEQYPALFSYLKCNLLHFIPDKESNNYKQKYPSSTVVYVKVPMSARQTKVQLDLAKKDLRAVTNAFDATSVRKVTSFYSKVRIFGSLYYQNKARDFTQYLRIAKQQGIHPHDVQVPLPADAPKLVDIVTRTLQYVDAGGKVVIYSKYITEVHTVLRTMFHIELNRRTNKPLAHENHNAFPKLPGYGKTFKWASFDSTLTQKQKDEYVRQYNAGEVQILLIGESGQTGLDLKQTSSIIITEPDWNDSNIDQAMARAIRSGSHDGAPANKKHVDVFRYIATFDEDTYRQSGVRMSKVIANMTADQRLQSISDAKTKMIDRMLNFMQRVSDDTSEVCKNRNAFGYNNRFGSYTWSKPNRIYGSPLKTQYNNLVDRNRIPGTNFINRWNN
jgi:hypothetical protein